MTTRGAVHAARKMEFQRPTRALPQSKKAKAPFRITGPGWHRTRDGREVFVRASLISSFPWTYRDGAATGTVTADGFLWVDKTELGGDIIARVTNPRAPARPKAARRPRPRPKGKGRYRVRSSSCPPQYGYFVHDTKRPEALIAESMTRSTARKLAAMMNGEGK